MLHASTLGIFSRANTTNHFLEILKRLILSNAKVNIFPETMPIHAAAQGFV
jgi:hypothetical protein